MDATLCGMTATRDPRTGQFDEPVYLYTDATPEARETEKRALEDFGAACARLMKAYENELKEG